MGKAGMGRGEPFRPIFSKCCPFGGEAKSVEKAERGPASSVQVYMPPSPCPRSYFLGEEGQPCLRRLPSITFTLYLSPCLLPCPQGPYPS